MINEESIIRAYTREVREKCTRNGWNKDWLGGGCYIHLETSEFIEALRGKGGDPLDELGDVLFTLVAVADYYGLDIMDAIAMGREKMKD